MERIRCKCCFWDELPKVVCPNCNSNNDMHFHEIELADEPGILHLADKAFCNMCETPFIFKPISQ